VATVRALLLVLLQVTAGCATAKVPPALPREAWPNLPRVCTETCPTGKLARPFEATIRFLLSDSATLAACCMEAP
jgi:hypothetical protein